MAEKDYTCLAIENAVEQLESTSAKVQQTHKLDSLRTSLKNMSMLVRDLDEQEVADWLNEVRELAYKAQDVISAIDNHQKKRSKLARLLSREKHSDHVEDIKNIEKGIEENICSIKDKENRKVLSFDANEVVGFGDDQETLVRHIIDDTSKQLATVLVWGMAGSGKTTLANMVYCDERIKIHFGYRKWVRLSQEGLLCRTWSHTGSTSYKLDLCEELNANNLQDKRYLIVIDNIQSSVVVDELLESYLPDNSMGSRLLLTSRVPEADLQMQHRISFCYEIKPLDVDHSWQLFSSKVLKGEENAALHTLGKRMAHKCKGSPRAILALAAILDTAEKTEEMWSKFLEGYDDLSNYNELSSNLRNCLSYFSCFPEGFHLSAKQLIQMWMAEGFLKDEVGKTAEEVIKNSFIQKGKTRMDGSVKTCFTFSPVYHLCKKNKSSSWITIPSKSSSTDVQKILGDNSHSRVSSLHWLNENANSTSIRSEDIRVICKFRQLVLLNLDVPYELEKMPSELGKLTKLKYMKLNAPRVKYLPTSITNLEKLETLDMRKSSLVSLPVGIWKLKCLRHLYLKGTTSLPKTSGSNYFAGLPNLHILSGVTPNKDLKWLIVRAKFPNVTKLRICCTSPDLSTEFLNSLDHLYHLKSLRVEQPTKLPDQHAFPPSLSKLTLLETQLDASCIDTLEKLPNLRILKLLKKSICGDSIKCNAGGFPQLEILYIEYLNLEILTVTGRAMQCVKHFIIKGCETLKVPDELKRVAVYKDREENCTTLDTVQEQPTS